MQEKHPATKHTAKLMVIIFVCLSPAGYHCKLHVCFAGLYLPASSCWFGMRVSTKTMRLRGEAPSAPLSHKPAMQNCLVLPNPTQGLFWDRIIVSGLELPLWLPFGLITAKLSLCRQIKENWILGWYQVVWATFLFSSVSWLNDVLLFLYRLIPSNSQFNLI